MGQEEVRVTRIIGYSDRDGRKFIGGCNIGEGSEAGGRRFPSRCGWRQQRWRESTGSIRHRKRCIWSLINKLKNLAGSTTGARKRKAKPAPRFVELMASPLPGVSECVIELEGVGSGPTDRDLVGASVIQITPQMKILVAIESVSFNLNIGVVRQRGPKSQATSITSRSFMHTGCEG
jgi:hypothetical protein